jgi:hypothetical protein
MVKIHRTTNLDARALVADDGRAYQLTTQRRALLRGQLGGDLPAVDDSGPVPGDADQPYVFRGSEPIIDCIRRIDASTIYRVTTGDFRELELTPGQIHTLLADE